MRWLLLFCLATVLADASGAAAGFATIRLSGDPQAETVWRDALASDQRWLSSLPPLAVAVTDSVLAAPESHEAL
ncbi:hypothetical protein KJ554_02505, partial [bacterium]|nr:hypothetical protein [bacterium]